jgi:nitroreductase
MVLRRNLMDAMDAILSRRSIRKYTPEPVPENLIQELLKTAMAAPSASNQQPWQFLVINDREILDRIPSFHPYSGMVKEASAVILVCGDLELETSKGFWVQDCSAATENLLLAAHALGLGSVWLGVYPREDRVKGLRKMLNLPDHIIPLALVPIGYPAEKKPPADRYNSKRVRYNRW